VCAPGPLMWGASFSKKEETSLRRRGREKHKERGEGRIRRLWSIVVAREKPNHWWYTWGSEKETFCFLRGGRRIKRSGVGGRISPFHRGDMPAVARLNHPITDHPLKKGVHKRHNKFLATNIEGFGKSQLRETLRL